MQRPATRDSKWSERNHLHPPGKRGSNDDESSSVQR